MITGILVIAAFLLAATGCTQPATPVAPAPSSVPAVQGTTAQQAPAVTEEGKKMVTYTESDNGTTREIAAGSRFAVQLTENPTTGYSWNATASPGLEILSSDYQENAHPGGMVGVGGVRTWVLMTDDAGTYTFTAVYKRPWMPTEGNETGYNLTISAVKA